MPIGKNSLKRVANNGYSNVKSEAPDMENSVELPVPVEKPAAKSAKKAGSKKTETKAPAKKSSPKAKKEETVKVVETPPTLSPKEKKTASPKVKKAPAPAPKPYRNIGDPLPVWLL